MRSFLIPALLLAILPLIFCGSNDGGAGSEYTSGDVKKVIELDDMEGDLRTEAINKLTGQVHEMLNAVKSADAIKSSLPDINVLRRDFAKALNISNMAKLTWNPSLATQASTTDCQEDLGPNFRSFKFHRSLKTMADFVAALRREGGKPHATAIEMFAPHQYQIGCVKKDCIPINRPFYMNEKDKFEFNCLMGPSAIKPDNAVKPGTPGSQCGTGTNEDGLCVMEKASGSSGGSEGTGGSAERLTASGNETVTSGGAMETSSFSAFLIFLVSLM